MKKRLFRAVGVFLFPPLGYLLMRFYWYSSKKRFHLIDPLPETQAVVVCWHEELFISPQAYRYLRKKRPASGIISQHFDGEIIARILGFFGIRPLRGSSFKGANKVLLEAFRAIKRGDDLLVTPDGPRGPRHSVSSGAVVLAQKAKLPILIVSYRAVRFWRAKSWDRFMVPKPFTTLDIYLQTLDLEGMSQEEGIEALRQKMLRYVPKDM